METSSAPDFAPAWLKLPAEKQKSTLVGESRSRSQQRDALTNSSFYNGTRQRHSSNSSNSSSGDPRRDSWGHEGRGLDEWGHYGGGGRFQQGRRGPQHTYNFRTTPSTKIRETKPASSKSALDAKFDRDFPSLKGDPPSLPVANGGGGGAWVNGSSRSSLGSGSRLTSLSAGGGSGSSTQSRITRTNLNPRLVTNPRNLSDRKSDFLRALRSSHNGTPPAAATAASSPEEQKELTIKSDDTEDDCREREEDATYSNGIDIRRQAGAEKGPESTAVAEQTGLLSSSLEAERRLLREMGWTEDEDDTSYAPLTEDEMREFEDLTKKMGQRKNGFQRGGNVQTAWNNRPVPTASTTAGAPLSDEEGDTSSLDSDSD